jgi:hypothetical protein
MIENSEQTKVARALANRGMLADELKVLDRISKRSCDPAELLACAKRARDRRGGAQGPRVCSWRSWPPSARAAVCARLRSGAVSRVACGHRRAAGGIAQFRARVLKNSCSSRLQSASVLPADPRIVAVDRPSHYDLASASSQTRHRQATRRGDLGMAERPQPDG